MPKNFMINIEIKPPQKKIKGLRICEKICLLVPVLAYLLYHRHRTGPLFKMVPIYVIGI